MGETRHYDPLRFALDDKLRDAFVVLGSLNNHDFEVWFADYCEALHNVSFLEQYKDENLTDLRIRTESLLARL